MPSTTFWLLRKRESEPSHFGRNGVMHHMLRVPSLLRGCSPVPELRPKPLDALRSNLDKTPKTPEIQMTRDLKEKIGELDKKLRKIEVRGAAARLAGRQGSCLFIHSSSACPLRMSQPGCAWCRHTLAACMALCPHLPRGLH